VELQCQGEKEGDSIKLQCQRKKEIERNFNAMERKGGDLIEGKDTHTPYDALQQIGEKESDGYKKRGRSNKRESMHTPRCVVIEEIKSFNATERERASKLERKRESFNTKKRKKVMARERDGPLAKGRKHAHP
jgi:hypothetical protein